MRSASPDRPVRTRLILVSLLAAVCGIGVGLAAAATAGRDAQVGAAPRVTTTASAPSTTPQAPSPSPSPTPDPTVEFTVVAGGDVLPHSPVVSSATTGDGIDFAPLMAGVEDWIQGADLALCHMEVPVAPDGVASGYPQFAAPAALVPSLAAVGFDGCSTASNHSVDRGFGGIEATHDAFEAAGMGFAGTARTEDEAAHTQMYEVTEGERAITVAHVSYAYGLNGLPKPAGKPWSVNTFDADAADAQPIIDAAAAAREQGADVVIASVHCCVEYQTAPTDAQRAIAQAIADSGEVDLYIGHHAHVPQPVELLDGGPAGDGMWTAFGLGNFLSNQGIQCCVAATSNGEILTATFSVPPDGPVEVGVEWAATTVDRGDSHAMHVLTDIEAGGAGSLSAADAQARHALVADAAGTQAPERTTPPSALSDGVTVLPRAADAGGASPTASPSRRPADSRRPTSDARPLRRRERCRGVSVPRRAAGR